MYHPETLLLVTTIAAVVIVGIRCATALCNRVPAGMPTVVPVVAPLRPAPLQVPTPTDDDSPPSYKEAVECNV